MPRPKKRENLRRKRKLRKIRRRTNQRGGFQIQSSLLVKASPKAKSRGFVAANFFVCSTSLIRETRHFPEKKKNSIFERNVVILSGLQF